MQLFTSGPNHESNKVWKRKKRTRFEPTPVVKNIVGRGPMVFEVGATPNGNPGNTVSSLGRVENKGKSKDNDRQVSKEANQSQRDQPSNPSGPGLHGIKTAMHVETNSPNHLRLIDEPRPSDHSVASAQM